MRSSRAAVGLFLALVAASIALRLAALTIVGHTGDVQVTAGWAERLAEVGPWDFYDSSLSVYPALLYVLWPLGVVLDGEALALAVKGLSIPFDIGLGIALFAVVRRRSGDGPALAVAALYLLNPGALLAGPIWGQVDAAGTLAVFLAMVSVAAGRHGSAGALAVLATLVKPQFGIALLPVVAVAAIRAHRRAMAAPLVRAAAGMALAYLAVAVPLALDPFRYAELVTEAAMRQPFTSLNAHNVWALLVGFEVPDDPYVLPGTLLLLGGIIGAMLGLRRRPSLAVVLGVGAALALAFYVGPTRVHERYLFPAIAFLAPFAAAHRTAMAAYLAISLGFSASLLHGLVETTPFRLPAGWGEALASDAGRWTIGLVLIGSAMTWAWLLVVRRPRLPARQPPRAA